MRRVLRGLTVGLAGAAVLLGVSSCGAPMPLTVEDKGGASAPAFGLLQTGGGRMLHYLIDSRERNGNTLRADVSLYQSGRVVVTGDMTPSAGANPTALIKVRLTSQDQDTLWQTEISTLFCESGACEGGTRRETWTYELGPRLAARVSNVWMTLEIVE